MEPDRLIERLPFRAMALAIAVTAIVAATAPAGADFSKAVTLARAESAGNPEVALDSNGNALIVWEQHDGSHVRIRARARTAGGMFGPAKFISAGGSSAFLPQVAIGSDGTALIVWEQASGPFRRIRMRARSAAGVLGRVQTLSRDGEHANEAKVAIAANGDALIVWRWGDRIQARARAADGSLGPIQTLSATGDTAAFHQVAMGGNGNAVIVWQRAGETVLVQARGRAANGVLRPVQTLSGEEYDALRPQVGTDGAGNALVVWYGFDGSDTRIQARVYSAGGALGPLQYLSRRGHNAFHPHIAMNAGGTSLLAWQRGSPSDGFWFEGRGRAAEGVLGPVQGLSRRSQSAPSGRGPEIAIDSGGNAVMAWEVFHRMKYRIQARTRSAGGALGPLQFLSRAGGYPDKPQVAFVSGRALVVWEHQDADGNELIQAAAGP